MPNSPRFPADDLLRRNADAVRALARGLLGDPDRAEDVLQDTWLAAAEHPPAGGLRRGWLFVVARNLARRALRGDRRRRAREGRAASPSRLPSPVETAERTELARRVLDVLDLLHEPYRSTLIHRYFDDLRPAAIARLQDVPVGTVKTRLHRGLRQMRVQMDARSAGERRAWTLPLLGWALPGATVAEAVPSVPPRPQEVYSP